MSDVTATPKQKNPLVILKEQIDARESEYKAALPSHIPVEKFKRVLLTAVSQNPKLVQCERRSLFNACMLAAQDGLLPDGREGAIVPFNDKKRGLVAQWFPMIAGLRKKVRNSGEIATWDCNIVYERDAFDFELGDEPRIYHRPNLGDRGSPIAAYSIAVLKSGEKSREVMSISEINKIRARSLARDSGPWVTDFSEMARKTVARRHSKVLPMSTDIEGIFHRDDDLYQEEGPKPGRPKGSGAQAALTGQDDLDGDEPSNGDGRKSITDRLNDAAGKPADRLYRQTPEALAQESALEDAEYDPDTGEVIGETRQDDGAGIGEIETVDAGKQDMIDAPPTDRKITLLADARAQAAEGTKPFTKWLGRLNAADFLLIEPGLDELRAIAKQADGEAAKSK